MSTGATEREIVMNNGTRLRRRLVALGIMSFVLLADCGGEALPPPPMPTEVTVSPANATVIAGGVQQFTSAVSPDEANQAVNWTVSGAGCTETSCGTIDATGKYTAPASVPNPSTVTVTVSSDADSTKAATASVTIIAALLSLSPNSLAFGAQTIHITSAPMTVTLTNAGSAPALVDSVAINGSDFGDFAQTNDCPSVIAADASCTFSITFTPAAAGNRAGYLVINGDLPDESLVPLTGVGTPVPATEYSARPDPRDCAPPECGGYFLYKINEAIRAGNQDFCTADLPLAAYVVKCMCSIGAGLLVQFYPSCNKPIFGDIEPDPDYKDYYMLVSPSCGQ